MTKTAWPILNTVIFTVIVPGTVAVYIPMRLLGGYSKPENGVLTWLGAAVLIAGAAVYFRCAWEFAVRGLGTPAPIAPTKFLVTSGLHRYVRNPMYIGVALAILGQAIIFRSLHVAEYTAFMLLAAHTFVILYEEPTLHRQFGESYDEYRRTVPRWLPRLKRRA
ncbi:MAG TPA: isoprenylcysteine carboxylmethyltransferase family protein [Candidatus Sulfotelmatobacter sp.]|nr:isoprenylcysteine carboxylmethyltransferase family protein [Candidatus Sulfotelmatobacter sp.]